MAGLTDLEVANLLTDKTRPGGHILFFTSSFAFAWDGPMSAKKVIAQWEKERPVERVGDVQVAAGVSEEGLSALLSSRGGPAARARDP